ncbi:MAG: hypothetical protein ABSH48_13480 [Verrucomicrobiota bacterium]
MYFFEHPLLKNSHIHAGQIKAFAPEGGIFEPALTGALAIDFSVLFSRRLGLADPMDPRMVRIVHPGTNSYKFEKRPWLDQVTLAAHERFAAGGLKRHTDFLELIQDLELGDIVVAPGRDGRPQIRTDRMASKRLYRNGVAIANQQGEVAWLFGLVCRPDFSDRLVRQLIEQRQLKFGNSGVVYNRLFPGLHRLAATHQGRFGRRQGRLVVTPEIFKFVDPLNYRLRYLSLETMMAGSKSGDSCLELPDLSRLEISAACDQMVPQEVWCGPEIAYPYYSDPTSWDDLTDFADEPDEPEEEWMSSLHDSAPPALNPKPSNLRSTEVNCGTDVPDHPGEGQSISPEKPAGSTPPVPPLTMTASRPDENPPQRAEAQSQSTPNPQAAPFDVDGQPQPPAYLKRLRRKRLKLQLEITLRTATEFENQRRHSVANSEGMTAQVKSAPKPVPPQKTNSNYKDIKPSNHEQPPPIT